jgi:phosphohistidine phosphatase
VELILWRHADAEEGEPDLTRNLTGKGKRQAKRMVRWLRQYLPKQARILSSPANRARQTADALRVPYEVCDALAPGCTMQQLLTVSGWPAGDNVVVLVGHNPAISELASQLLATKTFPMSLRKGGVLWLSSRTRKGEPDVVIKAAMVPSILKSS